jgi:hypothetical protein
MGFCVPWLTMGPPHTAVRLLFPNAFCLNVAPTWRCTARTIKSCNARNRGDNLGHLEDLSRDGRIILKCILRK